MSLDKGKEIREAVIAAHPTVNDAKAFKALRAALREYGGGAKLQEELEKLGFVAEGQLTTGTTPFNVFVRVASGVMTQPGMAEETAKLGKYADKFVIACNRPENDEHWESSEDEWVGKASMSKRHRFMLVKDLSWSLFNVLAFGLKDEGELVEAIAMLQDMQTAAKEYTNKMDGWGRPGLFFHVYGHASVYSLHMHILDMDALGPTYEKLKYKNLPASAVLQVLKGELTKKRCQLM